MKSSMAKSNSENVKTQPAVSIVVPCRNERDQIEATIRSVLAQESPDGGFEVIVADGMSDDGTRGILQELADEDPRLRIIDNPGRIVSTGLNRAIQAARGAIVARMDAHTEYASDYIRQCVTVLKETGSDNVGGPWVARGDGLVGSAIAAAFESSFGSGGARGHDADYSGLVDTVYLGCWPRDIFDRIGFFDEELVRNQDDEFNFRLKLAGGKIWQSPRIKSWYKPRASLRALFKQYMQYGYWKIRVIQKHKIPASPRHLVPGGFVLLMLILPLISLWRPFAIWAWLGLVGMYAIGNIAASCVTAAGRGWKLFPLLPFVFACYHFGYGIGFLHGIWDLLVLRRRRPRRTHTDLTRASASNAITGPSDRRID
jgi:glycosyltransferase involved in cell wall biosynthesis